MKLIGLAAMGILMAAIRGDLVNLPLNGNKKAKKTKSKKSKPKKKTSTNSKSTSKKIKLKAYKKLLS